MLATRFVHVRQCVRGDSEEKDRFMSSNTCTQRRSLHFAPVTRKCRQSVIARQPQTSHAVVNRFVLRILLWSGLKSCLYSSLFF